MKRDFFSTKKRSTVLSILSILISLNLLLSCKSPDDEKLPESVQEVMQEELHEDNTKPDCTTSEIELSQGGLCGLSVNTTTGKIANAYKGIPYGESTEGDNRWRPPQPASSWEGTFKATTHGLACPQTNRFVPDLPYSEDCLNLSVWVPAKATQKPLPVVIYIYGGSFLYGYNGNPTYDGAYRAANEKIILVTINYRVASLGFLSGIKDKNTGEEINGNFGLQDQVLAMKWIKDNINRFGGDPGNITLQGESAGAASVAIHLTGFKSTLEYFDKAIMQSTPLGIPYKTLKESEPIAQSFAKNLGCKADDLNCMRKKSAEEIVEAQNLHENIATKLLHGLKDFLVWAPVVDGNMVKKHPLKLLKESEIKKPIIIGTNKNEGLLFVSFIMHRLGMSNLNDLEYSLAVDILFTSADIKDKVLEKYPPAGDSNEFLLSEILTDYLFVCPTLYLADHSSKDTWVYIFDHVPSFNVLEVLDIIVCSKAVCHGMELPFVFNTAVKMGYSFTEEEEHLSSVMGHYWANFAKKTDPNGNAPEWPEFKSRDSNVILVTPVDEIESRQDLKAKCGFWQEIGYDIHTSFWDMF